MKYKCENCNHEGITSDYYALVINSVLDWKKNASPSLVENLTKKKFDKLAGKEFETLYISGILVNSLTKGMTLTSETTQEFFDREILPLLEKVNSNFEIIGHISLPAALDLAQTDLSAKKAVFCFPVVKYTGWLNAFNQPVELQVKLREIGIPYAMNEGAVDTITGKSWLDSAPYPTDEELMQKMNELQLMLEKRNE